MDSLDNNIIREFLISLAK